jgi:signal transduction histidine kinase
VAIVADDWANDGREPIDEALARPAAIPAFGERAGRRATAATTTRRQTRQRTASSPVAESLNTIAHELRTPLATLGVSLEVLAEWRELQPEEIDELVGRLQRGVVWLDRLVENLSAWSAVETHGLTLRRTPAPVLDWITPALALVRPLLDGRDQLAEVICLGEVPWVDGDATRLAQALVNLLVNASKYSVWGDRIIVAISVEERHEDGIGGGIEGAWVRVAVTDHGDGVLPEERERIFRRKARGLAALHSGERGHGIGLDVVSGVVEAHGGAVGVESAYGQGATFWFTLPRYRAGARE